MRRRSPTPSPPVVLPDPDARSLRWGWILWAVGTLAMGLLLIFAPAEHLPLVAVPATLLQLWPLWRGGRWMLGALSMAQHRDWHGNYYEFDGRQIRVLKDDDGALWICAEDVFDALAVAGAGRDPARVRLAAGRDGLRSAPGSRLLCFTERGIAAWLERRTEQRVATFDRWLKIQVLSPHHRRRALAGVSERTQTPRD